ncbi:MAG: hypothetical protein Q9207_005718 [Kuettlingeria erythrocarpa]
MESISRISSMLETARDLTLEAAQSAGAARSLNPRPSRDLPFLQVKKLLDSRNDRETLEGLRKVISMMYRSNPCLPFFSSVVKNVASPNIEIKKLVYIYLLHYAESEPDLALLSINTIQKSLSDQNPQVRAMALRVMSGIKVPVISQIVSLAIKKGSGDMSPYVRKAAALAIIKCYRLDPNTLPQLLDYLTILLGDKQYYVVGSAVTAFLEVCLERVDLIHKHYRALVRKLVDMDEWGQLATVRLMSVYARRCFPKRKRRVRKSKTKGFYGDEASEDEAAAEEEEEDVLDPDLELFLKACKSLLQNRNSAVIVAVARCYLDLGTPEYIDSAIGPLVALLRSPQDIQQVALYNIVSACIIRPERFVRYANRFLVHATDTFDIARLKFEVWTLIYSHCEPHFRDMILSELEHFTSALDPDIVQESVRAVGRCAQTDSKASARCLRLLLKQVSSQDGNLAAESLTVIRHLIQQDPAAHTQTVIRLAKNLDTTPNPEARATIIWLVGEFAGVDSENNIAPDVLRILTKGFASESEPAKLQIVLLAAKVYLHYLNRIKEQDPPPPSQHSPPVEEGWGSSTEPADSTSLRQDPPSPQPPDPDHPIPKLWSHILLLARYDTSYDLRDRTRTYRALLSNPASTQLASLLLLAPKPVPHAPSPSEYRKGLPLGSASLVLGTKIGAGMELPEWVKLGEEPDPRLRDEVGGAGREGGSGVGGGARPAGEALEAALREQRGRDKGKGKEKAVEKSLEDWLGEEEVVDDEEEESEDGSEEESEEETEEESEYEEVTESEEEAQEEGERKALVDR